MTRIVLPMNSANFSLLLERNMPITWKITRMKSITTYIKIENCPRTMYLTPTTIPEIKSLIKNLPPKTSSGCDDISNTLLKKISPCPVRTPNNNIQ